MRTETISVKVCRVCGATYRTPGMAGIHRQATGHDEGFKTRKETREVPSTISYQPGYGD